MFNIQIIGLKSRNFKKQTGKDIEDDIIKLVLEAVICLKKKPAKHNL